MEKKSKGPRRRQTAPSSSAPVQAFGHPVTALIPSKIVHHRPGFEDSPAPVVSDSGRKNESVSTILPPRTGDEIPKVTVATRMLRILAQESTELNPQPLPPGIKTRKA
jgi:hypothetical protein